jgi:hypothetical protein
VGRMRTKFYLTTAIFLFGCGSDSGSPAHTGQDAAPNPARDGGGDADPRDAGGEPSEPGPDVAVGGFTVQLVAPNAETETPGFTSFAGKVYDGPEVEAIVWEPKREHDGCTLLTPRVPFCETPCGSAVCVEDDTCQPYPSVVRVGTVTVRGLRDAAGAAEPITANEINGSYQLPGGLNLRYPAFDEGDTIRLEASGADVGAFTLEAKAIAPLELASAGALPLEPGKPFEVRWTPKGPLANSRIYLHLDISHHGGTKGKIECEVDDAGELIIPAELVDELLQLGVAGFPSVLVTRKSAVSTRTSVGNIELAVTSSVERPVQIPGLISCSDGGDCPKGTTCQPDLTCK